MKPKTSFASMTQAQREALPPHILAVLQDDDAQRAAYTPDADALQRELEQRREGFMQASTLAGGVDLWKHDASLYHDAPARPIGLVTRHPAMMQRAHQRLMDTDPHYRAAFDALQTLAH